MRIVLCTNGGLPGAAVLDALRGSRIEVAGIVRSTRILRARYGFLRGAWEQVRLSGLRYTAYLGCMLLARLPGQVFSTRNVNDPSVRQFIASLAPELIVSAFFNQRIGPEIAALAPAINIHPGLLPAFRGVDPVFYARLRGAPLGVTVHRLSPELDCGPILAQETAATAEGESVLATTVRLYSMGARLLAGQTGRLHAGTPQNGAGSYDSWPGRGEVAALRARGVSLVRARDLLARAR